MRRAGAGFLAAVLLLALAAACLADERGERVSPARRCVLTNPAHGACEHAARPRPPGVAMHMTPPDMRASGPR